MEKLRMLSMGIVDMGRGLAPVPHSGKATKIAGERFHIPCAERAR
jgi:hypothetical protein